MSKKISELIEKSQKLKMDRAKAVMGGKHLLAEVIDTKIESIAIEILKLRGK